MQGKEKCLVKMHSGGFSFVPSTSNAMNSVSVLYPGPQSSLGILQPPRLISRLRDFPLDLRYRPVTPPSTPSPSPPRKRTKILNLDLKTFDDAENEIGQSKRFSHMNQFSSTISIDNKKYFQNSVDLVFPTCPGSCPKNRAEEKSFENSESNDFIDITSSDNEIENYPLESARKEIEIFRSDSNLTEDVSNSHHDVSENSDEIVDIESNEDSVVFSELAAPDFVHAPVLENGKMFFEDPKLHSKAVEGFAKLFGSSLYNIPDMPSKKSFGSGQIRNKSDRKRVKSRKQIIDEETTSPVSGTIIRKLHDGEELVVRKGDIDPVSEIGNLKVVTNNLKYFPRRSMSWKLLKKQRQLSQ